MPVASQGTDIRVRYFGPFGLTTPAKETAKRPLRKPFLSARIIKMRTEVDWSRVIFNDESTSVVLSLGRINLAAICLRPQLDSVEVTGVARSCLSEFSLTLPTSLEVISTIESTAESAMIKKICCTV